MKHNEKFNKVQLLLSNRLILWMFQSLDDFSCIIAGLAIGLYLDIFVLSDFFSSPIDF